MGAPFAAGGQGTERGPLMGSLPRRDGRGGPSGETRGRDAARPPGWGLMRLLYTSNPFYILSADLVFAGLRMSFGRGGPAAGSWALAGSLAGYTLLLATTACLLIRLGRLWDDLRTLLLVIVIMFLAIAMSGDDFLAADHRKGALGCVIGLAFAAGVSEVVLHVIRLRLPGWYRAAYHAMLALMFLYPVAMVPLLGDPDNPALQWALFGFGPAAALAVILLVPAARRGSAALNKNGSPWRWPLYPWSLFVVLAGGLCVRAWSLCVSFHYVEGSRSVFGPYFLVPIGLAAALVWMEIGLASRAPRMSASACFVPMVLVLLAALGHRDEPVYAGFLDRFMETFGGSPAYLTALAAVAFLAYAGYRGVRAGVELLPASLIVLALVGPRTIGFDSLTWPRAVPMALAAIVLAANAWHCRDWYRAILAVACVAQCGSRAYSRLRDAVVGLDFVVFGLLFFAMAASISLRKAGLWPRAGSRGYNPRQAAEPRPAELSQAGHPGG